MTAPSCKQALQTAQTLGLDRLDAQLLLLHALGKSDSQRAWLLTHDDEVLEAAVADVFGQLSLRRAAGEPLAYIVGYKEFFSFRLNVDARVLVPRPDTETLVHWSLDILQEPALALNPQILDLGTGSGAIAIAIALSLQTAGRSATVYAVDASAGALAVASENARRLRVDIQFIESDWLENVSPQFHLIASNPPYIASTDPHLTALMHEPLQALTAGSDGLDDIQKIIAQVPGHLQPGGWLLLEHGYDQSDRVCELLVQQGFAQVQSRLDLAGIARCSGGQWPK